MNEKPIVLASGSETRKYLLKKIIKDFEIANPAIDETPYANEQAENLALRLAEQKALAVKNAFPNHLIIAGDQVALLNGQQLHKPGNFENNFLQLQQASGQIMSFYSSLAVLDSSTGRMLKDIDQCTVKFKQLNDEQIRCYIKKDQPYQCAGGFKAESLGIALFQYIDSNDPNTLIGLPLIKLITILQQFEISVIA